MAATTIPEQIVPSVLTAYTGDDFMTVAAGTLPNTNASLLYTSAATSQRQKAHQTRRTNSHLLPLTNNSMSFWFRRRAAWTTSTALTTSANGSTVPTTINGMIMGVGDPMATLPNPQNVAWGLWAYTSTELQFGYHGFSNSSRGLYCTGGIPSTLNNWDFYVFNSYAHSSTSGEADFSLRGRFDIYRNGILTNTIIPTNNAVFYFDADGIPNYDIARFAIGDPSMGQQAAKTADGPSYDIAKLAFHSQHLSVVDQLTLMEAMRYGPAS